MNKPQRHLVLSVLATLAIGLHFWFCKWGAGSDEPMLTLRSYDPPKMVFLADRAMLERIWDEANPKKSGETDEWYAEARKWAVDRLEKHREEEQVERERRKYVGIGPATATATTHCSAASLPRSSSLPSPRISCSGGVARTAAAARPNPSRVSRHAHRSRSTRSAPRTVLPRWP